MRVKAGNNVGQRDRDVWQHCQVTCPLWMLAPPSSSSIFNNLQFHSDSSSAAASILRCAMTRAAALLSLILASSLLHARASILCTWTKVSPNDEVHYAFLQSDLRSTPPALRLHHSAWSARRALLACAWSDDAAVVQSFLSRCRQRPRDFSDHPNRLLHSLLEGVECASLEALRSGGLAERRQRRHPRSVRGDDGGSEVSAHLRVKRGFIVPGTLWCGSGNKAPSFEDLGWLLFCQTPPDYPAGNFLRLSVKNRKELF